MFKKTANSYLAIDLAPECVRVLEVAPRRGAPCIQALAREPLGEGAAVTLPERHMAALERILSPRLMHARQCVAAMPTSLVTTRTVSIDPAKPQTPEEQIGQTLNAILPGDAQDVLFDFWNVTQPGEKSRAYEVLVVAAQRTIVRRYLDGFHQLKLLCTHLDVAPCALASLMGRLLPQQKCMLGTVALGETLGYFAMVDNQRVLFWRSFEMPPAKNGPQSARERIGDEISKCVSHMIGAQHLDPLEEVILFGKNAHESSFGDYIASRFNVRIKTPSPFESIDASDMSLAVNSTLQDGAAVDYAVALGLAWQGAGGRHG